MSEPVPGAITICLYCECISILDAELKLRKVGPMELQDIYQSEQGPNLRGTLELVRRYRQERPSFIN